MYIGGNKGADGAAVERAKMQQQIAAMEEALKQAELVLSLIALLVQKYLLYGYKSTNTDAARAGSGIQVLYVSSYCYICVLILLCMCPHTARERHPRPLPRKSEQRCRSS
jgi:hypothetical protein